MFINQKITKFLFFLFCFSIFSSISQTNEDVPLNNIAINEIPKPISTIIFEDSSGNEINLNNYHGKLVIINFWATWCAPCKKEMPSLDVLQSNNENIKVFPINLEKPNQKKTRKFFEDLNIKSLEIYFDPEFELSKKFKLKGVPTTIILDKSGKEFARIIGEVDFNNKKFLTWLKKIN